MSDSKSPTGQQDLAQLMKQGMRHLASGVVVLATRNADGKPHGMTITAVNSLSDDPPSLLVCIHRDAESLRALRHSGEFSVNVLNREQQVISNAFAFSGEGKERFEHGTWLTSKNFSSLYLQNALATFFCNSDRFVDYGSHCIVIGRIAGVITAETDGRPLIYYNAGYHDLGDSKT